MQGATVAIGGSGFNGPLVNLYTAQGNLGPLAPLAGGTSTQIQVTIPAAAPTGPGSLQVVNFPYAGNVASNAVSLPIGARIGISGVSQTATAVTVAGSGFSSRTIVNLFNAQGGGAVNLGGLDASGNARIPLTSVSPTQLTFAVPAGAADGAAFVQLLNPPFIPFSSSGNDPDGAFHLVVPGSVSLQTLATGLSSPTAIATAGDTRLFIDLQGGRIVIWDGSQILPTPFLDIHSLVGTSSERGLLGLAFHPQYAQNGLFFIDYTDTSGNTVIARYHVSAGNPNLADAASGVTLLHITQPFANHNGGQLQFGPDGYLYIGMGDGGGTGDPDCRAQSDATLLGKLLRIDVDQNAAAPPYYGIPAGNPFAGPGDPLDEIWAKGLRNPWRFSFDRLTARPVHRRRRAERARRGRLPAGGQRRRAELRLEDHGGDVLLLHLGLCRGGACLQRPDSRPAHPGIRPRRRQLLHHRWLRVPRIADAVALRRLRLRRLLLGTPVGGPPDGRHVEQPGAGAECCGVDLLRPRRECRALSRHPERCALPRALTLARLGRRRRDRRPSRGAPLCVTPFARRGAFNCFDRTV